MGKTRNKENYRWSIWKIHTISLLSSATYYVLIRLHLLCEILPEACRVMIYCGACTTNAKCYKTAILCKLIHFRIKTVLKNRKSMGTKKISWSGKLATDVWTKKIHNVWLSHASVVGQEDNKATDEYLWALKSLSIH